MAHGWLILSVALVVVPCAAWVLFAWRVRKYFRWRETKRQLAALQAQGYSLAEAHDILYARGRDA